MCHNPCDCTHESNPLFLGSGGSPSFTYPTYLRHCHNAQGSWGLHLSFPVACNMPTCCWLLGLMFHNSFDCKLMKQSIVSGFNSPAPGPYAWSCLLVLGQVAAQLQLAGSTLPTHLKKSSYNTHPSVGGLDFWLLCLSASLLVSSADIRVPVRGLPSVSWSHLAALGELCASVYSNHS